MYSMTGKADEGCRRSSSSSSASESVKNGPVNDDSGSGSGSEDRDDLSDSSSNSSDDEKSDSGSVSSKSSKSSLDDADVKGSPKSAESVCESGSGSENENEQSESEGSDNGENENGTADVKELWERDPELFGIRRSSRQRETADPKPPKLQREVEPSPRKSQGRKRRISSEDDQDSSDDEGVQRTVRSRGAKVVSYREDGSEEDPDDLLTEEEETRDTQYENGEPEEPVETIEKVLDYRIGRKGATGSCTTLYAVAEKGDPNNVKTDEGVRDEERQFLIKWTGWSHLHNTWESLESLTEMKVKGLKKLDNFCKREDEVSRWKRLANPEDIEYYECQLELQQELSKSYMTAERIFAEKKGTDGQLEYYVKWENLPYAEATWENAALVKTRNPEVIETYRKREACAKTPTSSSKSFRYRPKFRTISSQPKFLAGGVKGYELRDYQLEGLNWLVHSWCKENSVILADEMGLGKTIQTISFLAYLFEACELYGPFLVVVPLSTMAAWQREFALWGPQMNVVTYLGDVASREIIREYEFFFRSNRKIKFNVVLTTYEIVLKDKDELGNLKWAVLMVDEAHRLKNADSLLYRTLYDFDTNHRLLITGTPLQNSLKELWSLLHFIMPAKFDDWEYFEKEHDQAATKGYAKLHRQLEPFILRRVKKDVEKSLPAKVEQILRVEMTNIQRQYYKWILTKNYTALKKGIKGSVSSFVNVIMELKKCCNHAQLVRPIENPGGDNLTTLIRGSGKLMLLDKLLVRLKETGHRVLIFSQMVRMLDIIAEYLQLRRFSFQRLDGSIKGDIRKQALDHFNAEGSSDFCFLLSTRAGGLGINLATADTVIIFDSDWNPQNDLQAQARAHRIGQKNQVNIYRLVTKQSVEEDIVERAKRKMVLDHLVIQRMDTTGRTVLDKGSKSSTPFSKDELNAILKFGAEELFKQDEENDGEDHCDIDEILRRAETHEDNSEKPGDELLSAFKVASFAVNEEEFEPAQTTTTTAAKGANKDWEQIIPEDIRQQVEKEEKEKEMAELYLPPRNRGGAANGNNDTEKENVAAKKVNRKRRKGHESEESDSDDDRPKSKRGRPRLIAGKESIKGFNDNQIRKFIRSFKRFPKPLLRVETIARDAELEEKSIPDLKKLGETIYQRCLSAMAEAKANPVAPIKEENSQESLEGAEGKGNKKPREKGPIFKLAGVSVNAKTLWNALEELEPLGDALPKDETARKNWKFEYKAKVPPYDVEWGPEEDTRLLLGVWEYGMGSWKIICESDEILKGKFFTEGDKKPQLKHLQSRAEYLFKVLNKNNVVSKPPVKKPRKPKKGAEGTEAEAGSSAKDPATNSDIKSEGDVGAKTKPKRQRKKKDDGPKHYTQHAGPQNVNIIGDLDPVVFNECKEKMRPVKKALRALDKADTTLPEKEQVAHTRSCLMQIGDQIQVCLQEIDEPVLHKQTKTNLWYFVSKFTEYDPSKLYKLYKKAKKDEKKGSKHKDKSDTKDKKKEKKDRDVVKDKKSKERDKERGGNGEQDRNASNSRDSWAINPPSRPSSHEVKDRPGRFGDPRERNHHYSSKDHREWDNRIPNSHGGDYRSRDRPAGGENRGGDHNRSPGGDYRKSSDPRDRDRDRRDYDRDRGSVDPRERNHYRHGGYDRDRGSNHSSRWGDQNSRDRPPAWVHPPNSRWAPPPASSVSSFTGPPPSQGPPPPRRDANAPQPAPYYIGKT